MKPGCAVVAVILLLVLAVFLGCPGKEAPKPPPQPAGDTVDSLTVVLMPMTGDTSQACAFARLTTGRWALTTTSDSLPVCRDSFREWLDTRDVQRL